MSEIDSKSASDLSAKQRQLLELMLKEKRDREKKNKQDAPREMIPRRAPAAVPLLSFAQQRLWFIEQFQPGTAAYNIPSGVRIKGPLEAAVLDRSVNEVIKRHEALRSTYALVDRQPQQVIAEELRITLAQVDLRRLPRGRREDEAQWIIDRAARTPFEMATAPPWRMLLVRIDDQDNVLLVVLHHIIADTWTTGVFFREMVGFIRYFSGERLELPELPIQYADYALWQRQALAEGGLLERQVGYWQEKFEDAPALLDLPLDRPRPAIPSFRGGRVSLLLPNRLTDRLKALAGECDATLFMVFMAGLQTLLFRTTHQHDILVGTPMANRNRVELENLIGLFVNTLVLRTDFSGDPPFRQLLAKLRETTLEGLSNHDVPFERVVEELTLERDTSRNPLFQVIFAFQNVPIPKLVTEGLSLERYEFGETTARLDLELDLQEMPYGFVGWLGFNADLFDPTTAHRLCADYRILLEAVAADADRRIGELPLMRPGDRHQLLAEWNDTRVEYPRAASIHELFAEQAARRPEAVAVVDGGAGAADRQLSYRALDREANRLSHHLRALGVGPEDHVAVCLERSAAMIVALLGILKAGGAYLPVDPDLPRDRLAFMLEEAGASLLLTEEQFRGRLAGVAAQMVCVDAGRAEITALEADAPDSGARAENLAYVNFTSGSTGTPKGVSVPHRAVVRLVRGSSFAELGADEVFLLLAPLSFDASTLELWGSLLNGARLAIYPDEKVALAELGEALARHRVSTLWLTAGLFHLMMDERPKDLRTVRQLLAGGDVLSVPHVRRRMAEQGRGVVINGYGPTEGTTFTCCHPLRGHPLRGHPLRADDSIGASVSIGRPIANTRTYVVDRALRPVPLGVAGELEIAGDGLARGYLNRPDLTAERFVPDPLSREPGARCYRSGDLVRHLADGTIEFFGRFDHQVKIRGFRLELGEIEAVLGHCPEVTDCVVVARRDPPHPKRLVAYVVAAERDPEPLRAALRDQLPEYMMPAVFVFLDALPLGATGKIDRGALPAPESEAEPQAEFAPPQGELEQMIAERWARALNVEEVGRDDNFFEIGGNSLLLAQIHNDLRSTVAPQLTLVDMFQYPTVGTLAGFLGTAGDRPTLERTLERAVARRKERREEDTAIAIIGLALRFPGANTPDQFWENLVNGVESVLPFDRERALEVGVPAQLVDDPNYVLAEGSIDHVDTIDYEFFGYGDPAELELVDPQQRIFMENAWEALERAGYDPAAYDGTIGIIAGANISSYMFSSLAHLHDPLNVMAHFLTRIGLLAGNQGDFLCTRIAYQLNLTGPAITAQTACSTTLVAVHLAAQSLLRRECDMCLAGGVQIRVPQRMGYMYQEGGFPSPDGHCRSFDAGAQGNVHGNGSGVVLLKRLADAVRGGDTIHAVIKGAAVANDGSVKVGFSAPGVEGQAKTVAEALTVADVDPAGIGYLEAAGTATELGDPIEIEALTQAYRLHTDKTGYCPIGSVKTNIGHLDVASGAAALIKTVLTLEREQIPASLHFEKPNPNIDFDNSPFFVNVELRPWPRGPEPRRAAVHSYAVGGTNAHLILEEAPVPEAGSESRAWQLLVVSARSAAALEEAAANLAEHLRHRPELPLADVAYTLQVGRRHFGHRRFVLCRDGEEAAERLAGAQGRSGEPGKDRGVAFLLPDGSAFEAGMTAEIYRAEECFRSEIDRCAELLGRDPEELLAAAPAAPVVFALEYALAQLWAEWGVRPQALVGSGVGELVAACLEGTLPLAEALARAQNEPPAASATLAEGVRALPEDAIRVLLALGPVDGIDDPRLVSPAAGGDAAAALQEAVGRLWLAGIAIDWKGFYRHQRRRRVTLPTYPFERVRIWAEAPADQPQVSAAPSATEKQGLDDWFYAPSWQRCEQPAGPRPAPAGGWLVLADGEGVGAALARRLREDGGEVVTVAAGEAFAEIAPDEYAIDPGRSEDYRTLIERLHGAGKIPTGIVHLWSLGEVAADADPTAQDADCYGLILLARGLVDGGMTAPVRLEVVTRNVHEVTGEETLDPARAMILAPSKVIPQELMNVTCRSIDVLLPEPDSRRRDELVEQLRRELGREPEDRVVALRGRRRWVQRFPRIRLEAASGPPARLRPGGVYLILGEAQGFALLAADYLARTVQAKLAFVGYSGLPEREAWDDWLAGHEPEDETAQKIRRLRSLEALGSEVLLCDVEITDGARAADVVAGIDERFGGIDGVIHTIGDLAPELIRGFGEIDRDFIRYRLRSRLLALVHLSAALEGREPDFTLLASTVASVLGGAGLVADCAADIFLDHYAQRRSQLGTGTWTCVDWDAFRRAGEDEAAAPAAITPEEGAEVLARLLAAEELPQVVVVSTVDLEARQQLWLHPEAAVDEAETQRPRPELDNPYLAPRNEIEREVAEIWARILGLDEVGVEDNYFDLGGNSLLATQIVSALRDAFQVSVSLQSFFEGASVANVAAGIEVARWAGAEPGSAPTDAGDEEEEGEI